MLVSADDVAATLQLLVPGFIALSVFYWFGLSIKRTDWRWTLWSLVASAPLSAVATPVGSGIANLVATMLGANAGDLQGAIATCSARAIGPSSSTDAIREAVESCVSSGTAEAHWSLEPFFQLLTAVVLAVLAGFLAVAIWRRLARRFPNLRRRTEPLAWGSVLRTGNYLIVKVENMTYLGWSQEVADPVEVDAGDLDLYLTKVQVLTPKGPVPLDVQGVILRREDIKWIQVLLTETDYLKGKEASTVAG